MEQAFHTWLGRKFGKTVGKLGTSYQKIGSLQTIPDPLQWIENTINLSDDKTSSSKDSIKLDPWQIKPFLAQFERDVETVVIVAVEQIGKSTMWRMPMLYRMRFTPSPAWIIYEAVDKAELINRRSFKPLLESIPEIKKFMNRKSARVDGYDLDNGFILDFTGAGADITSKPIRYGVADELDRWGTPDFAMQNLRNFTKRFRNFKSVHNCLTICSSPKTEGGKGSPIWKVFQGETNESYWSMRCDKCGKLSMRSCDTHNLQFEYNDHAIVNGSCRLKCPLCNHEHDEDRAYAINENGDYIEKYPERKTKKGFQIGCLGVPRVFKWETIAEEQIRSGSTSNIMTQVNFDNSWRGLPFSRRRKSDKLITQIKALIENPPAIEKIEYVLLSIDTQDIGFWWVSRAYDENSNSWLVGCGFAETNEVLDEIWEKDHYGKKCLACIIDEGGRRKKDVDKFKKGKIGVFSYKGNTRIASRYIIGKEDKKLILAQPKVYQAELIYYLYNNKIGDDYQWRIGIDVKENYYEQVTDVKPNNATRDGHSPENWEGSKNDHFFDCEKMQLVIKEFVDDKRNKNKNKKTRSGKMIGV